MINLLKQIIKFGIVGGLAFLIDYSIFALLTFIGIHYLLAQLISFSISLAFNYCASIKWVFDTNSKSSNALLIIFVFLSIIGLIINEILLYIGIDIIGINELITKLFSTLIVMIYNFITRKKFIEKK